MINKKSPHHYLGTGGSKKIQLHRSCTQGKEVQTGCTWEVFWAFDSICYVLKIKACHKMSESLVSLQTVSFSNCRALSCVTAVGWAGQKLPAPRAHPCFPLLSPLIYINYLILMTIGFLVPRIQNYIWRGRLRHVEASKVAQARFNSLFNPDLLQSYNSPPSSAA